MKIVLDSNIYDLLAEDQECLKNLTLLIENEEWMVLAPATINDELKESPFGGIPEWLNVIEDYDSVFVVGYTKLGTGRIGKGEIYTEHKGESKKIKDAVIVDFAVKQAEVFVTEDIRSRSRLKNMNTGIQVYNYEEFKNLTNRSSCDLANRSAT